MQSKFIATFVVEINVNGFTLQKTAGYEINVDVNSDNPADFSGINFIDNFINICFELSKRFCDEYPISVVRIVSHNIVKIY
jgi:hypothetical protein